MTTAVHTDAPTIDAIRANRARLGDLVITTPIRHLVDDAVAAALGASTQVWLKAELFRRTGSLFSEIGDRSVIDGFFVNGSARVVGAASAALRLIQSGYMYLYAFAMILGVFIALFWWVVLRVV